MCSDVLLSALPTSPHLSLRATRESGCYYFPYFFRDGNRHEGDENTLRSYLG